LANEPLNSTQVDSWPNEFTIHWMHTYEPWSPPECPLIIGRVTVVVTAVPWWHTFLQAVITIVQKVNTLSRYRYSPGYMCARQRRPWGMNQTFSIFYHQGIEVVPLFFHVFRVERRIQWYRYDAGLCFTPSQQWRGKRVRTHCRSSNPFPCCRLQHSWPVANGRT
jgi:hypothetical protein